MSIWMYYETDGDSGYYNIRLFMSKVDADRYNLEKGDPYGHVSGWWAEKPR